MSIAGIRDHNLTFSQSLIQTSQIEQNKSNFFEQENNKLKLALEEQTKLCEESIKQSLDKLAFFKKEN